MRRRRRWPARLCDWLRSCIAFLFSNVGIIFLVVGYIIAGAFMFQAIEGASEIERVNQMAKDRERTAHYLWQNTNDINTFNETALKYRIKSTLLQYQSRVVKAVRRGWDGGRSARQWSFSSAFLYSLTVITTIGYGHISPRTNWGKVTTVFYSLLGMPIFLLYLANVGSLLARWFKCLYALICLCRGCPGFSRRRVVRTRTQLEISEAESIERPDEWKSDSDVSPYPRLPRFSHRQDHRGPLDYRPSHRRISDEYRIPPYRRRSLERQDYRYEPNYRYNNHSQDYRCHPNYRSTEYSRHRDVLDHRISQHRSNERYQENRVPLNYRYDRVNKIYENDDRYRQPIDMHNYRYPREDVYRRFPSHRLQMDKEEPQSRFLAERYPADFVYPKRYFQRHPAYNRSSSMPQPHTMPSAGHYIDRTRGWSEPIGYTTEDSSEFSYVTFDAQTITVPISVCVAIMVSYIFFGSMLFGLWEKWDQLDGAYFCFISLSSIGFGDFVPGERVYTPRIETSFIVCSLYLMFGMALVAMCFNLMQEQVIHYVAGLKRAVKRVCRCASRR